MQTEKEQEKVIECKCLEILLVQGSGENPTNLLPSCPTHGIKRTRGSRARMGLVTDYSKPLGRRIHGDAHLERWDNERQWRSG